VPSSRTRKIPISFSVLPISSTNSITTNYCALSLWQRVCFSFAVAVLLKPCAVALLVQRGDRIGGGRLPSNEHGNPRCAEDS
jgi:hypothetical protein